MHTPGVPGSCCWYVPSSYLLHPPVLPSLPLRGHALGQQLLLRLGQQLEKLGRRLGIRFL